MPDLNSAIKGRRANLKRIWSSKEWKEKKAEFLKVYPNCEMHKGVIIKGRSLIVPATLPHHPWKTSYKKGYSDLEFSQCVAYCSKCHFAIHHGMKLCPVCGEHYCPWDAPMCKRCFDKANPGIVTAREKLLAEQKEIRRLATKARNAKMCAARKKHPCKSRLVSGRCQISKIGTRCQYAPTKAEAKCMDFVRKKGVKV